MKRILIVYATALLVVAGTGIAKSGLVLHRALENRQYDEVLEILKYISKSDIDELDNNGNTPLTIAAENPAIEGYEMVRALLARGADVNKPNATNWRPIYIAAGVGNLAVVELMVDKYLADLEPEGATDAERSISNPLYMAYSQGHTRIAQFLESRGARMDPYIVDLAKRSGALEVATKNLPEIIAELAEDETDKEMLIDEFYREEFINQFSIDTPVSEGMDENLIGSIYDIVQEIHRYDPDAPEIDPALAEQLKIERTILAVEELMKVVEGQR